MENENQIGRSPQETKGVPTSKYQIAALLAMAGLTGGLGLTVGPMLSGMQAATRSQRGQAGAAYDFGHKRGWNKAKNMVGYGALTGLAGGALGAGMGAMSGDILGGAGLGALIGMVPGTMYGHREHLNDLDEMYNEEELIKLFGKRYPLEMAEARTNR
jgi:hypothetical protein